jgi:hypothetical protein
MKRGNVEEVRRKLNNSVSTKKEDPYKPMKCRPKQGL